MIQKPKRLGRVARAAVAGVVISAGASALTMSSHAATVTLNRVAGANRYETSAMIAETKYPSGVAGGHVVLATGLNFPDALAGNYLAGQLGAPILLTTQTTSDPAYPTVTGALAKLLPGAVKMVTILGGTSAVGSDVQSDLQGKGYVVNRIGGATRYDTAQMVDTQTGQTPGNGTSGNPTAFVATGQNFPDALSAGPVAWNKKFPIVLTDGSQSSLSPQAQSTLTTDKIKNVLIMGGSAAINPGINTSLAALGINVDKQFAGADRTDTAGQLAAYAQSTYAFGTSSLILASGQSFPDALSAGPWGGDTQNIYLTATSDSLGTFTDNDIKGLAGKVTTINIAGGTAVVDSNAANGAQSDAGGTSTTNATYSVTPSAAQTVATSATTKGTAQFTASSVGTQAVDLELFNCNNVQSSSGKFTFTGTNPGGAGNAAVQGTVSHETITVVNGTAQGSPGTQVNGITPSSGAVTFTVSNDGTPGECVTPVLFQQPTGNQLPLGTDNSPTIPFGVGAPTTFSTPAATGSFGGGAGSTAPTDTVTANSATTFTTSNGTYTLGSGDTYQIFSSNGVTSSCSSSTLAAFKAALSNGDKVGGNYQPTATSTFCLNDIAPAAPTAVTAVQNTTAGGITLTFVDSATPDVTTYNVYRTTATQTPPITGTPFMCPTLPAPAGGIASPQTPPASPWTKVGSPVTDSTTGSTAGGNTYTFQDTTAAPASGTPPLYCYAVTSIGPSAGGTEESTGAPANTNSTAGSTGGGQTSGSQGIAPAPAPTTGAPAFSSATAQGVTVTVTYNQAINPASVDSNASDFTVTYATSNTGTPTQNSDTAQDAFGSGSTVTIEVATAIPVGDFAYVTAKNGTTDSNTVCANGGTSSCETVGDKVVSAAATAAGAAPTMGASGSTASAAGKTITVKYSAAIDCASVDTNGGDYSLSDTTNPLALMTVSSAACTTSGGTPVTTTTSQYVTIKFTTAVVSVASGDSLTITAQNGGDGNTVVDPATGAPEAVGNNTSFAAGA